MLRVNSYATLPINKSRNGNNFRLEQKSEHLNTPENQEYWRRNEKLHGILDAIIQKEELKDRKQIEIQKNLEKHLRPFPLKPKKEVPHKYASNKTPRLVARRHYEDTITKGYKYKKY